MLVQLVDHTLWSNNGGTLSSDTCGTGHLSKVTSSKLLKLIQPVHIYHVVLFTQVIVVLLVWIMVVLDISLRSLVVT